MEDGADYVLNKIQGVAHGGGVQVAADTDAFTHMERFVGLLGRDEVSTTHTVGLFPSGADASGRQGFARVVNHSETDGEVRIDAYDDAGTPYGPLTLEIAAGETVHFNSDDLEAGNADKGLDGATGPGDGDWRLELSSPLELEVLAYIRTEDGFLTSMHDMAPQTGAGHRVVTFNPGSNASQVSSLRLVNPSVESASVRIKGIDDDGWSPGTAVELDVPGGQSRTLSAKELETGEGVSGALGTGEGKWRLVVSADRPIAVMSLLSSPTGHLTNLSTAPAAAHGAQTAAEVFRARISEPIVQSRCIDCHVEGGRSGHTRLVFEPSSNPDHETLNLETFRRFVIEVEDGADYILNKIQGVPAHGGGVQVPADTPEFEHMERFLRLLEEEVSSAPVTAQTLFDTVRMAPARRVLRRSALIFAGRAPTEEEYAAAEGGGDALRSTVRGLMTGPEFHEFLIRAANDRLLTDRREPIIDGSDDRFVDFANEHYRQKAAAYAIDSEEAWEAFDYWYQRAQHGFRRAPLELIAHVAENDLPYTEILTADYIMANRWAAQAYGAPAGFGNPDDSDEFKPSRIARYYRRGEGLLSEWDPILMATRVLDPGPLSTHYPHAGILNTTAFLLRYPTTATNRNRARSRWTYYHFLGLDIEKSASRTTDPEALADTNNPTMHNPACTVCHRVLDPVAGTFQNYGDGGFYRDQWGGLDSLDDLYKEDVGSALPIQADSWRDRETLTWPVSLAGGVETLRVVFANPFYDDDTGNQGFVHLDRIQVTDAAGQVLVSREFEEMDPPIGDWGSPCGEPRRSPGSTRVNHLWLHWGEVQCAIYIDVTVPSGGVHNVEIIAWATQHAPYPERGFARLAVSADAYREGDTWYRDMRIPGFNGESAPNSATSVQWLAQEIVSDERFAEAAVKFWWPAIMGSEVTEPPEDEGDASFEGLLLAANAQRAEMERLASGFRRGFAGGAPYNLKDLLVEIVLSEWFRADVFVRADPVRRVALRDAGARRLLTPEELDRKTAALTGFRWGRNIRTNCWPECRRIISSLTDEYRLLYGGIDSEGITKRGRDLTSVMAGVARRHAAQVSCPVVIRELYLLPDSDRRLFNGIGVSVTGSDAIRSKLTELFETLLGVQVTPHSPDVEAAYRLFVEAKQRRRAAGADWFEWWRCDLADLYFFEDILGDVVVWHDDEYGRYLGVDWDRVGPFMETIDWSDPHYTAQAWVVVLAYLLTDHRYLYL